MAAGEAIAQLPENFQQVNLLRMDGHDGDTVATPMQRSKRSGERILRSARLRLHCLLDGEQSDVNEPRTGRTVPTRG
jgi:hypothetical protein